MAAIKLLDFVDYGTGGYLTAVSYQFALDPEFTQIIDESLHDTVNLTEWTSMLPKIGLPGYYADLDKLYARIKVHVDEYESEWYVLPPQNQNIQNVVITEEGKEPIFTTSIAINMI